MYMKTRKVLFATVVALGMTTTATAQSTVSVNLSGLPDGTCLEARLAATHQDEAPMASATLTGGKATLTLPITEMRYVAIGPKDSPYLITLMTDNGEKVAVSLKATPYGNGSHYTAEDVSITGSVAQQMYQQKVGCISDTLNQMYAAYHSGANKVLLDSLQAASNAKDTALVARLQRSEAYQHFADDEAHFFQTVESTYMQLFRDNRNTWWGPFAVLHSYSYLTKEQAPLWDMFSTEAQSSFYGQMLKAQLMPDTFEGNKVPTFNVLQADGTSKPLAQCVEGKKYYLVDFWASWCRPCRKEIPNLKSLYARYKDKGLGIVSISIDTDRKAWLKALNEEQLPWPNGIDTAGIAKAYRVQFIPAIFLVDAATGKCLQQDLRGEQLANRLAELLK